ncbi:hypothetical protein E1180_09205 [Roseibium denhamense]|uniref:Carbohydrate-binding domain-containing protein n=1 Tax=Roseibium denhamense TaxID=76305 RepID=A0ABY1N9T0_9HYPH|nr:hypothetical protein [Roseibium denhamense]MTI05693.1 hypothetical protein [Roseibium denhamense]SMP04260.1 hypothetical protein SAMN06265374_0604 [Roseibium denhamense]
MQSDVLDAGDEIESNVPPEDEPADDSGTPYSTRYQYFYVPAAGDSGTNGVSAPGAFLRLGSYSDIEEDAALADGVMPAFYPAKHISDEASDATVNSGGPNGAGSCGMLLACDGRVLLRASDRLYINTDEKIHIQSGDKITIIADTGDVSLKTGKNYNVRSAKKVSMRSGIGPNDSYSTRSVNSSGEKGIEIIADEGSSDVYIEGKSLYLQVNGTSTADVTEDNSTIMRADNYEDIWGNQLCFFRGRNVEFYFGYGFSYRASVSLNISTAIDINIGLFDVGFLVFDITKTVVEVKASMFKAKTSTAEVAATATRARSDAVSVSAVPTKAESGVVTASTGSVKSLIAFWEAKIANTAQI